MTESNDPLPSLESLKTRIDTAKSLAENEKQGVTPARRDNKTAQLAGGLAAGAAVGGTCGYFIDRWLATSPIGLIIGFFLGFAAGLYNLMRQMGKDVDTKE